MAADDKSKYADWVEVPADQAPDYSSWTEVPAEETGTGTAAGRGFLQGATMGYSDEALGRMNQGTVWLAEKLGLNPETVAKNLDMTVGEWIDYARIGKTPDRKAPMTYEETRDSYRALNKKAEEDAPLVYGGSKLAGNIATSVAVPGGAAGKLGIKGLGAVAARGAVEGAINASGMSEADNLGDLALDTAIGAGTGAVLAPVAKVGTEKLIGAVAPTLRSASNAVREFAQKQAGKAVGASDDVAKAVGKTALEIDGGMVKAGDTAKDIAKRAAEAAKNLEKDLIEDYGDDVIDAAQIGKRVEDEVLGALKENGEFVRSRLP